MPKFGQSIDEYEEDRANRPDDDSIWIKNLKEGSNQMRILHPVLAQESGGAHWITQRMHYDAALRFAYPCAKDAPLNDPGCIGCNHANPAVKQLGRKYMFPAISKDGRMNVYQVPAVVKKTIQAREQRTGSVIDRDVDIIRTGMSKENTTYEYDWLEKYAVDLNGVDVPDIGELLGQKYEEATATYNGSPFSSVRPSTPEAESEGTKAMDKPAFDDMESPEIKEWLKKYGFDAPEGRIARSKLVELAETSYGDGTKIPAPY